MPRLRDTVERQLTNLMPHDVSGDERRGTPLVLVPGGLSGWNSWKPHAELLSKNHRVIRVQLLNLTAAEKNQLPDAGYSLQSETVALRNTMSKLGIDEVSLVGWSHGGEVALDFALNYPNMIRTLTLIEPYAIWIARAFGRFEEEIRRWDESLEEVSNPPTEDDIVRFMKVNNLLSPGVDPRSLPQWLTWNSNKVVLLSLRTISEHSDDLARLKVLRRKPVLLVKGRDSDGLSGIVDLLAKSLGPQAKVITLPDGHTCHIVARDQFIAELEELVRSAQVQ